MDLSAPSHPLPEADFFFEKIPERSDRLSSPRDMTMPTNGCGITDFDNDNFGIMRLMAS